MKAGLSGALGRMAPRERTLVITLLLMVIALVLVGAVWVVRGKLKTKQDQIAANRASLNKIQKQAGPYLESRAKYDGLLERLKNNPDALSPDNPVATAAVKTKVRFRNAGDTDEPSTMNKVLQVTGDLKQRPLLQKKKGQKGPQIFRVDKEFQMRRGYVHVDDLFTFLGEVEALDNLVFISKLDLVRWTRDPDYVQIKSLAASTLRYSEDTEE